MPGKASQKIRENFLDLGRYDRALVLLIYTVRTLAGLEEVE
jgi:hypothetical protein